MMTGNSVDGAIRYRRPQRSTPLKRRDGFYRLTLEHRRDHEARWQREHAWDEIVKDLARQAAKEMPDQVDADVDLKDVKRWVTDLVQKHHAEGITTERGLQLFVQRGWDIIDPDYLRKLGLISQHESERRQIDGRTSRSTAEYQPESRRSCVFPSIPAKRTLPERAVLGRAPGYYCRFPSVLPDINNLSSVSDEQLPQERSAIGESPVQAGAWSQTFGRPSVHARDDHALGDNTEDEIAVNHSSGTISQNLSTQIPAYKRQRLEREPSSPTLFVTPEPSQSTSSGMVLRSSATIRSLHPEGTLPPPSLLADQQSSRLVPTVSRHAIEDLIQQSHQPPRKAEDPQTQATRVSTQERDAKPYTMNEVIVIPDTPEPRSYKQEPFDDDLLRRSAFAATHAMSANNLSCVPPKLRGGAEARPLTPSSDEQNTSTASQNPKVRIVQAQALISYIHKHDLLPALQADADLEHYYEALRADRTAQDDITFAFAYDALREACERLVER